MRHIYVNNQTYQYTYTYTNIHTIHAYAHTTKFTHTHIHTSTLATHTFIHALPTTLCPPSPHQQTPFSRKRNEKQFTLRRREPPRPTPS